MAKWLGSWDSRAAGVYRPGVELAEEQHYEMAREFMMFDEAGANGQASKLNFGPVFAVILIIVISAMLFFPEKLSSIFY